MYSDENPFDLRRAAARAAVSAAPLLAATLASWRRAFPADDPARTLAVEPGTLDQLSLCRRPRAGHWVSDAEEIAAALAIEPDRLIGFLRAAEALEVFRTAGDSTGDEIPRLLAARDDVEDGD